MRLFPNGCEAFTQSEIRVNLSPLPSVPHVCEVELTISLVLHAGETSFKVRGNSIGMGTRISGSEVEVALMPSGEDVRQIIESCILWRRFKVLGLQVLFDQFLGFRGVRRAPADETGVREKNSIKLTLSFHGIA